MNEIKCPHCGKVFQVDDTGYTQIAQQVRDNEFEKEIHRREEEMKKSQEDALKIAQMEQEKEYNEELANKDAELSNKEREIEQLKAQIDKADTEKKLAVTEAVQEKEKELSKQEAEITKLQGDLELQKRDSELREKNIAERHEGELKLRDEEIERLKDFKIKQGTKLLGESLEQHCANQFNSIRATAFPGAYFEKDNDAKSGSKGDFIFKDYSDGVEFISIMFEMKNEQDATKTKKTNESFLPELDKDRNEKGCEYAVLVSLLEQDNELYNNGIVDVSHRYPKMFVVRPQFFIPIISLLRNAALNSLEYQKKLAIVEGQQLDLRNFEDELSQFKAGFVQAVGWAKDRYDDAIKGIDKTIDMLTEIKKNLQTSENHFTAANNKLDNVSIKKLTKNAPSVREMFEELKKEGE